MKEQVLTRLAFDGGLNDHFTNPAPVGMSPPRFSAPSLAQELVELVNGEGQNAVPALMALTALELDDEQLRAVSQKANPAPALRQTDTDQNADDDQKRREIYLGSLRVLAAQRERARPVAGRVAEILRQEQAPGLKDAQETFRAKTQTDWEAYQADAAQTLLAIGGDDLASQLDRIVDLWVKVNSPDHLRASNPHERRISPCALAAASPGKLATVFASHIRREAEASTATSTFLLVDALTGLACTETGEPEHLQLVASIFNSHSDPNEPPLLGGEQLQHPYPGGWGAARPESVRGAAAAALIRLGAAGRPGMPSIKEALGGINRGKEESIDENSLPGPQWLVNLPVNFRKDLGAAAAEMLGESDARAREVGARVLTDLWLAGGNEDAEAWAVKLHDSARRNGDTESLRSLLLIAHSSSKTQTLKSQVKELFGTLLKQEQGEGRRNAVIALGRMHVKDESPRIRIGVTYIPVLMDAGFAGEFAPALFNLYQSVNAQGAKAEKQEARQQKKADVLKALGHLRRGATAQIQAIIATESPLAGRLQREALDATAKSGPSQLLDICRLLEGASAEGTDASIVAATRATAYYVSGGNEPARVLISILGKHPDAVGQNQSADEVGRQLRALLTTLNGCEDSQNLRNALGHKLIAMARTAEGKENAPLLRELAGKYQGTMFADEILKQIEPQKSGFITSRRVIWFLLGLLLLAALIYGERYLAEQPLRRLDLYEKVPEIKLPIPKADVQLPLRPLARLILRPFRPQVLDAWVQHHADAARERYLPICSGNQTSWPYTLKVNDEQLVGLETRNLQTIFSQDQVLTVIMGATDQKRSKLACLIGWWAMTEQPGGKLCSKHLMLPVIIDGSLDLLDKKEGDLFLRAVTEQLRSLIGIRETIHQELLHQLMKWRRVLVIVDCPTSVGAKGIRRFASQLSQYPANARIITSGKGDVLKYLPRDIIDMSPRR